MNDGPVSGPDSGLADPPDSAFSLQHRPAAGLYLFGWLLTLGGLALLLIAFPVGGPAGGVLLMTSLLLIAAGLAAAAGYQVIARRSRPDGAYRGPTPLLLFPLQVVVVNMFSLALLVFHLASADDPVGFFITALMLLAGYAGVVWLFVVRTGALRWRDLGLTSPLQSGRVLADLAGGLSVMLVVAVAASLWGGLIAALLGTTAPDVVPASTTGGGLLLVALGAGVVIPIGEELFFRGYALSAWKLDLGERSALVRATVFFAFVHILTISSATFIDGAKQAVLVVAVIAPVGLALGWLFLRRGLIAAIAGHATFNLFAIIVTALAALHN